MTAQPGSACKSSGAARRIAARQLLAASLILLQSPRSTAAAEPIVTAIASRVSDDYSRAKLANGAFAPETYSFGPGGFWGGAMRDSSIDDSKFSEVAKVLAGPLALQNYQPSAEAKTTRLLIMVYWGATTPPAPVRETSTFQNAASAFAALQRAKFSRNPSGPRSGDGGMKSALGTVPGPPDTENAFTAAIAALQAENAARRRIDAQNAGMLGYDSWWSATTQFEGTPFDFRRAEMLDELEETRYFVVLMAYDFQLMWQKKKSKLLWETRFSISERGHAFDRELAAMAQAASRYFGRDSHGLRRQPLPETHVELGELQVLGYDPDKK